MTEQPDHQDAPDAFEPNAGEEAVGTGASPPPEGEDLRGGGDDPGNQRRSPSLETFLDSAGLVAVGGGSLYLVGLLYFRTYFGALGLGPNEIIFAVPVYVSQGFFASTWLLAPVAVLAYQVFLTDREPEHPRLGDLSLVALLAVLSVYAAVTTERRYAWGFLPVGENLANTVVFYGALSAFGIAIAGLALGGSMVRAWTQESYGGKASVGLIIAGALLANAWMVGAVDAEQFRSGLTSDRATVVLEDGAAVPTHSPATLYHIITHEDSFYFLEIWQIGKDSYGERVHVIPDWNIQRINWTSRPP